MKSNDIFSVLLDTKLKVSEKLIERLPEGVRKTVRDTELRVLSFISEQLNSYVQQSQVKENVNTIKKVEID